MRNSIIIVIIIIIIIIIIIKLFRMESNLSVSVDDSNEF